MERALTDGFELAEVDLTLRGEGTILGERQKGRSDLKLARLAKDRDLLDQARRVALALTEGDHQLSGQPRLVDELRLFLDEARAAYIPELTGVHCADGPWVPTPGPFPGRGRSGAGGGPDRRRAGGTVAMMRVIGGRSRGRRLIAPLPEGVRPTSDRVREAIFDILYSAPAGVEGATVVDSCAAAPGPSASKPCPGAPPRSPSSIGTESGPSTPLAANLAAVGLSGAARPPWSGPTWSAGWQRGPPAIRPGAVRPPLRLRPVGAAARAPPRPPPPCWSRAQASGSTPDRWQVVRSRRYGGTLRHRGHPARRRDGHGAAARPVRRAP